MAARGASAAQLSLAWLLTKGAQLGVRVQPIGYVHTGPCPYNATNSSFCTNASLPIYCKLGLLTDPEMRPTCVSGEHNRLRCTRPLSLACGPHTDGACCR